MSRGGYTMRRDDRGVRRKVAAHLGVEGYYVTVSIECSGCTDVGDYGTKYGPFGCRECGHTGRRRHHVFEPFDGAAFMAALDASSLSGSVAR